MKYHMQLKLLTKIWTNDKFAFGGAGFGGSHPSKKRTFRPELAFHVVALNSVSGQALAFASQPRSGYSFGSSSFSPLCAIYAAANAGNHLHPSIEAPSREHLSAFLMAITGRIAQLVGGTKRLWDARPFSRIVSWGRDFQNVARYVGMNSTEMAELSRENVRSMFDQIQRALRQGLLAKSLGLVVAGLIWEKHTQRRATRHSKLCRSLHLFGRASSEWERMSRAQMVGRTRAGAQGFPA